MSTIVTRNGKGSPLTFDEADANFTNLNNDKYQANDSPTFNVITGTTYVGLPEASSVLDGIVPASGGGTANFLRADMTWAPPTGTNFVQSRQIEFAGFGGNGANIAGFGGPNLSVPGLGAYSNPIGQVAPIPASANIVDQYPYTRFYDNTVTWGVAWGSTWSPFIKAKQPFGISLIYRQYVINDATKLNWAFGFGSTAGGYPSGGGGIPEAAFTNFIGFRIPKSGDSLNILANNRASSTDSATDTGIPVPTTTNVYRFTVYAENDIFTLTIETADSNLDFNTVWTADYSAASVANAVFYPTFGGPSVGGTADEMDLSIIRGVYTI